MERKYLTEWKRFLTEQTEQVEQVGIGDLIVSNVNIEQLGDVVKISFNKDNLSLSDLAKKKYPSLSDENDNSKWNCAITLTKNDNMIDGSVQCQENADVERDIMRLVGDLPKPANTPGFFIFKDGASKNILTAFEE